MRAEEDGLEAHHGVVAGREVRDRLDPGGPLEHRRDDHGVHPGPRARVVVDVDEAHLARFLQPLRQLDEPADIAAQGRIELDRDDPLALAQRLAETGLALLLAEGRGQLPLLEHERRARFPLVLHRGADGGDLDRRRAAAAADDLRAELACVGGKLAEVVRRGVREDDAAAGKACEADVGQRGKRQLPVHLFERRERRQ